MPKTNAPMTSEGPSGAIAPPYFGLSAATGTTTSAQIDNDDQTADQTTRVTARQETPPGGGVAEFGLEEGDAKAEAAKNQGRGRRLMIEQHQRDQDCRGAQRKPEEKPVDANGRAPIGRGQSLP